MKIIRYSLISAVLIASLTTLTAQDNASSQWPQFRGYMGSGILDGAGIPATWNLEKKENILWNIPVAGLAHSCPVIWDNRVFIATAVSSSVGDSLKIGLYGDIDMAEDQSSHQFKVACYDLKTGKLIWEKIAWEGVPKERRHTKSTYANQTPATDGKHLVVSFGANGLYCYDMNGKLLWSKDLGRLATGPFDTEGVEWGSASSPIIHEGKVIIQADQLKGSYLELLDVTTGSSVWRIEREKQLSSWGSPAIYANKGKTLIITNGFPYVIAYDFSTGKEVWKISGVGDAPSPTAIVARNLVYINSAHGKWSPIIAIRPDSEGDLTLGDTVASSPQVPWMIKRGGAYMASLLVYGDNLYNMQISGLLSVLDPLTGKMRYRQNLAKAFSASPVASDGKVYLTAETGEVFVIDNGPEYKLLAQNNMNDPCMATPAITKGIIIFRTQHRLIAIKHS
jgi:outer membrane protein assembly factor BamB